jgi:hypothetical protein
VLEEPLCEARRRTRQPAVRERFAYRALRRRLQLDEDGRVAVEVRDREERLGIGGENRFLLAEVVDPDREDRAVGRGLVPEPLDVGLAERPFPREALLADEPRAIAEALPLGDLRELRHHACDVVESDHGAYCSFGVLPRDLARRRLGSGGRTPIPYAADHARWR